MVPQEGFLKGPITGVWAQEADVNGAGVGDLAAWEKKRRKGKGMLV